jgi:hypothetical protein
MAYGGQMAATVAEQRYAFIEWASTQVIPGSTLKTWVTREGFNPWQFSIMLGVMVKEGLVDVLGPFQHQQGQTYKKSYRVTESGRLWADHRRAAMVETEVDPDGHLAKVATYRSALLARPKARVGVHWLDDAQRLAALREAVRDGSVSLIVQTSS